MINPKTQKGFTLIELLVVLSMVGFLAALTLVSFTNARFKTRMIKRVTDLRQIQKALELYYSSNNNTYPSSSSAWRSQCTTWGGYTADTVIPGLVPGYAGTFPSDPHMVLSFAGNCYLYKSDGTNYIFLDYIVTEFSAADYQKYKDLIPPGFDNGSDNCLLDGNAPFAWGIYSEGAKCWQ